MPETFRYPFGKPGKERFRVTSARKRSPKRFDAAAIPAMRGVWETGDWNQRESVLTYLVMVQPVEGVDLAWEALTCDDEMLRGTAAIAAMRYVQEGLAPTPQQVDALVAAARSINKPYTKSFLLMALEAAAYENLQDLLAELTDDDSPEVRFDANYGF